MKYLPIIALAVVASVCGCSSSEKYTGPYADIRETGRASDPWWMNHRAVCPDNMRMVTPSDREIDRKVGWLALTDDRMNWSTTHTYCINDGMDGEK